MSTETTLPLSVHIGSTPLDRLLFNCPARVTCAQLLQSVQQALPHAVLSHLSTFHHDRIPLDAEMSQYVQAHDAVIANFTSGREQLQPSSAAPRPAAVNGGGAAGVRSPVRMAVAPSSAFAPTYGLPHPPPPHMMQLPHNTAFSPSHPPMPPMPFMMYGPPPPPPSAYHPPPPMRPLPLPPASSASIPAPSPMQQQPAMSAPQRSAAASAGRGNGSISMVEACQLATQSVKPALDRYRTTHPSAFLQSGSSSSNSAAHSPTARALLASLKRDEVKRGRKRAFQRVSGDVEAETESEGVSDDESMGSASSWSAVDDEADHNHGHEESRAAQAAQLIASLSQSPSSKRTTTVKLEHDAQQPQSGPVSRLIRSTSPIPTSLFDSASLLKDKRLKHASVLVLYQAKEESRSHSHSLPSTPASFTPSSSPASPVHSMVLSPASSAMSSPTTPSRSVASSHAPSSSPRAAISSPSSHATTSHAAHPSASHATVAVAASTVSASAASSAIPTPAHFIPSPSVRHRSRLGIPVMRDRRRRRRRTMITVAATAATTPGIPMTANTSFPVAAAVPAMPVTAASPAKAVMAAISYAPNNAASYQQQQAAAVQAAAKSAPAKDNKDDKRTYSGKVRVYHNVPINIRTGRVSVHG